jgi:hypothetical protein
VIQFLFFLVIAACLSPLEFGSVHKPLGVLPMKPKHPVQANDCDRNPTSPVTTNSSTDIHQICIDCREMIQTFASSQEDGDLLVMESLEINLPVVVNWFCHCQNCQENRRRRGRCSLLTPPPTPPAAKANARAESLNLFTSLQAKMIKIAILNMDITASLVKQITGPANFKHLQKWDWRLLLTHCHI